MLSRRKFIQNTAAMGSGLLISLPNLRSDPNHLNTFKSSLHGLASDLLFDMIKGLKSYQIKGMSKALNGGIICPACSRIHGRVGDALYPFLYAADKSGESRYIDYATMLYSWMEKNVSMPDGSFVNDVNISDWKGITVFSSISLGEALKFHGHLLGSKQKQVWENRFKRAIDFLLPTIHPDFGMINYPATSTYAFALAGEYFGEEVYAEKAKVLAQSIYNVFTPNEHLLYGEGLPRKEKSERGTYPVDLGYNVEESLPALTLYSHLLKDDIMKAKVIKSLKGHLDFLLPDGGWDNSWGTRNYKWTYWGSRTSDGCQPAYGLLYNQEPGFYKAAYLNTKLLSNLTVEGLLYGGPHLRAAGIPPCNHHTFCHAKALASFLNYSEVLKVSSPVETENIELPRESRYGVKKIWDLNVFLVAEHKWKATITNYDRGYLEPGGNASGGTLSMLWHEDTGPILSASRNHYELTEANNMQMAKDVNVPLTPRVSFYDDGVLYSTLFDLNSTSNVINNTAPAVIKTDAHFKSADFHLPPAGKIKCTHLYQFEEDKLTIRVTSDVPIRFTLPFIAQSDETVTILSDAVKIDRKDAYLLIKGSQPHFDYFDPEDRIFNFVPGFQAFPIEWEGEDLTVSIEVKRP